MRKTTLLATPMARKVKELVNVLIGSIDGVYNRPYPFIYRGRFGLVPRRSSTEFTRLDG
jgi:hypothetical protein